MAFLKNKFRFFGFVALIASFWVAPSVQAEIPNEYVCHITNLQCNGGDLVTYNCSDYLGGASAAYLNGVDVSPESLSSKVSDCKVVKESSCLGVRYAAQCAGDNDGYKYGIHD